MHAAIMQNRDKPVTEAEQEEVRELVSRVRVKVLEAVPFFGHLLLKMNPVVTRSVPLAGVTFTRELLINPDWAMTTTVPEFAATLVHEVLHCALLVWERQQGRTVIAVGPSGDRMSLWNVAHDYVVNQIIVDMANGSIMDPTKWDPPGLFDAKYKDMSAEEVYDDLLQNLKPPKGGKNQKGQPGQPGQPGSGQPQSGGSQVYHPDVDAGKSDVQDATPNPLDPNDAAAKADAVQADARDWKQAIVEAAQIHESKKRGDLPGALKKLIKEITDPRVSWIDILARWMGENGRRIDFSWRRPSRRSESVGEFLPSLKKHGVDEVVVLWDSSGSMGDRHKEIVPEVLGIAQDLGVGIRVIVCDAAIHSDTPGVENVEDIDFGGGGGSDFRPAFSKLDEEEFEGVVVVFTDGYIAVPPEKPHHLRDVLWCIWPSERGDQDPTGGKWGTVIVVDEDGKVRK